MMTFYCKIDIFKHLHMSIKTEGHGRYILAAYKDV